MQPCSTYVGLNQDFSRVGILCPPALKVLPYHNLEFHVYKYIYHMATSLWAGGACAHEPSPSGNESRLRALGTTARTTSQRPKGFTCSSIMELELNSLEAIIKLFNRALALASNINCRSCGLLYYNTFKVVAPYSRQETTYSHLLPLGLKYLNGTDTMDHLELQGFSTHYPALNAKP